MTGMDYSRNWQRNPKGEINIDIKKDVQKQFGENANSYVESKIHREGLDLKKMVELGSLSGHEEVLDVATGGGHTANAFAPHVRKVTAVDLTLEMLVSAEKFIKSNGFTNVDFVQGDAEMLPFPEEAFHIVTCRIAPHHFPNVERFASEVYRVLKTGGVFLLDDNVAPEDDELDQFYNNVEKMRDYSHFRAWKKTEWIRMLELRGFEINECHQFKKTFKFEPWCNRMKLSDGDKQSLNEFMLNGPQKAAEKFNIMAENGQIQSFQGEALILKAIKY